MTHTFFEAIANQIASFNLILPLLNALINVLFAAAIAKDAGKLAKQGQTTLMVSGLTWAFASLIGGVFVAAVYWLIHHSTLTRRQTRTH